MRTLAGRKETETVDLGSSVKDAYLASDPKATMQPHEPVRHRFNSLPLALLQTDIRQTSAWLLSQTENEWRYPAAPQEAEFVYERLHSLKLQNNILEQHT